MERRQSGHEQAEKSWRAALLAPLHRPPARGELAAAAAVTVEADSAPTAELVTDGPTDRATEAVRPQRKQAIARAAIGQVLANVYHDPNRHTVTLLLDEQHAIAVIYAVRAVAADYEAHAREVRAVAATLPLDSYGHANRQFIAIRHERIASRLRLVEANYRTEVSEGGRPAE